MGAHREHLVVQGSADTARTTQQGTSNFDGKLCVNSVKHAFLKPSIIISIWHDQSRSLQKCPEKSTATLNSVPRSAMAAKN